MIGCDKSTERKDLRKVVNKKKEAKRGKTGRKEKQGCKNLSQLARHLANAYAYHCGLRVRASPTPSAGIKLLFPTRLLERPPISGIVARRWHTSQEPIGDAVAVMWWR